MEPLLIFEFNLNNDISSWKIVNDVVMGGKSESKFYLNQYGNGTFEGKVTLDNNGGFCSVKYNFEPITLNKNKRICIRHKGDGKKYQFRVKTNLGDSQSYVYSFQTSTEWQTTDISISELHPTFRGRKLDLPNYDGSNLEEIAFLIGNKKEENFQLLIDRIEVL
ncbi:CIA30 family protein [Flavobacterium sp. LB3P45]|uniref:CIA30 family protein n=1 Tax=Flavobacterium fructosi TaxID=3230416 RepID=A0ABW6HNE6_9FLAO